MTHFIDRDRCPACDHAARKTLFTCKLLDSPIREHLVALYEAQGTIDLALLEGGWLRIQQCGACGLFYHDQVPDDLLMEHLYERWIDPARALDAHRAHVTLDTRMMFIREIVLAMTHLKQRSKALRALDFGMGWGDWCLMARALGCEVCGSERSPSRVANARRLGIEVVSWSDIATQRFDLINCDQVLEHVIDPHAMLAYLAAALEEDGLLKVSVPDGADLHRRLARGDWSAPEGSPDSLLSITPLQHINCFTHTSLVAMAARAGLRVAEISLATHFESAIDRMVPSKLIAGLTRPLGRTLFTRDTYVFFERARP
jgi:SAM-dependent methyltransferase